MTSVSWSKRWVERYLAAPALATYCAVLLVAAVPQELVPPPLRSVQRALRLGLRDAFGVSAGVEVFAGNAGQLKQRLICMSIFGVDARGPEAAGLAFQSYPNCKPPHLRLGSTGFEFAIDSSAWLLFTQRGDVEPAFAAGARDARLTGIARYFCTSAHSPIRGTEIVVLVLENQRQHYTTGAIVTRVAVVHEHMCTSDRARQASDFEFEAVEVAAGGVALRRRAP